MGAKLLFLLLILLAGSAKAVPCAPVWRAYDYKKDAVRTALGNEGYKPYALRSNRTACRKSWTVLVYMSADADLMPYALWNLYEMESGFHKGKNLAGSSTVADVIVEMDQGSEGRRLHLFETPNVFNPQLSADYFNRWTAAQIQSPIVSRGPYRSPRLEDRLVRFLEWGTTQYPSDHYLIIFWGHGLGWTRRDIGQARLLDVKTLGEKLKAVTTSRLQGQPFDIFTFDACLMQTVEVASEMAGSTRFLVGSTEIQQYQGLPYRRLIYEINTRARVEPGALALLMHQISQTFAGTAQWNFVSAMASPDLEDHILPALKEVGHVLARYLKENRWRAIALRDALGAQPSAMGGYMELGRFFKAIDEATHDEKEKGQATTLTENLLTANNRAALALSQNLLHASLTPGRSPWDLKGLTIWVPQTAEEVTRGEEFLQSSFYQRTGWGQWVKEAFF